MQKPQRLSSVFATDMHVLAKDGELLCQITVQTRDVPKARPIINLAVIPALKRMRATACNFDIEPIGAGDQCVAHRYQLRHQRGERTMHRRADFQHALGDFRLDLSGKRLLRYERNQVRRAARQITGAAIDQLQLELDADSQQVRRLEFEHGTFAASCVNRLRDRRRRCHLPVPSALASPLSRSAYTSANAPAICRITTLNSST